MKKYLDFWKLFEKGKYVVSMLVFYLSDDKMDIVYVEYLGGIDSVELNCIDGGGYGVVKVFCDMGELFGILC